MIDSKKLHIMRASSVLLRTLDKFAKNLAKDGLTRAEAREVLSLSPEYVDDVLDQAYEREEIPVVEMKGKK